MENIKTPIYSFNLKEILDGEDANFLHRSQRVKELESPVLLYAYANTLVFEIKSSHFGEKVKTKDGKSGVNQTKYKVFVLFEDFYCIGKDKEIDFEDAIDFAIDYGDVHIRCSCPSFLYHGFAYMSTQLKYLYGIPRENRFPIIRNPNLKSTACKHCDAIIEFILRNKVLIAKMFAEYYNRLSDNQSIYAVNPSGTTITIGHKNSDGDVFFERQLEEEAEEEPIENIEDNELQKEIDKEWEDLDNLFEEAESDEKDNVIGEE